MQPCAAVRSCVSSPAPLLTSSTEKIEVSADPKDCLHGADGSFRLQERKNWNGDKTYVLHNPCQNVDLPTLSHLHLGGVAGRPR